jgi:hypothetical protein
MYKTTLSGGISILCSRVFLMYELHDPCTDFALYAVQETWFWLHLPYFIAAAMLRELQKQCPFHQLTASLHNAKFHGVESL